MYICIYVCINNQLQVVVVKRGFVEKRTLLACLLDCKLWHENEVERERQTERKREKEKERIEIGKREDERKNRNGGWLACMGKRQARRLPGLSLRPSSYYNCTTFQILELTTVFGT